MSLLLKMPGVNLAKIKMIIRTKNLLLSTAFLVFSLAVSGPAFADAAAKSFVIEDSKESFSVASGSLTRSASFSEAWCGSERATEFTGGDHSQSKVSAVLVVPKGEINRTLQQLGSGAESPRF